LGCSLQRIGLFSNFLIPVKSSSLPVPENVCTIFEEVFDDDHP